MRPRIHWPQKSGAWIEKDIAEHIACLNVQMDALDKEIKDQLNQNAAFSPKRKMLETVKGIGPVTQAAILSQLPDAELFKSLPGMGPCMGPRMLAALGDNRDRFNSAEEIQNYAGIAPVTERSGQKSWVHWRWQCAKFVRQTFVEWAAKTVNSS
jgi:transposase